MSIVLGVNSKARERVKKMYTIGQVAKITQITTDTLRYYDKIGLLPFVKRNEFHLVDPLKIEETIEKLQIEVDEFEVEVDAVLSEINALTEIEI